MKTLAIFIFTCIAILSRGQTRTEQIHQSLQLEHTRPGAQLMILNITGHVSVTTHTGSDVIMDVTRTVRASSEEALERGWKEAGVGILTRTDTLMLYLKSPCHPLGRTKSRTGEKTWNYCWENSDCDEDYEVRLDFSIKVPTNVSVHASTVNDGDVTVKDVRSAVTARNVNGSIYLQRLGGVTSATTVNGDVDLDYTTNPTANCRYYTLNGNIHANFKPGLAADIAFKTFNGEFFTNLDNLESLPMKLVRKQSGNQSHYQLAGARFRTRTGGILLDFETFNGDVILKEVN
ncbi:MAG: hypothetical protein K1X47_13905 [Cyclobacteriaceae bacterium]|nr:hypothetical protein [Cyclobacteriaceae bacterium]